MKDDDKQYQLSGSRFKLVREQDGQGDSGRSWEIYNEEESVSKYKIIWDKSFSPGTIKIGYGIRVGALTARTYSYQDWWQCTAVRDILETSGLDKDGKYSWIRFKTNNSIYMATGNV